MKLLLSFLASVWVLIPAAVEAQSSSGGKGDTAAPPAVTITGSTALVSDYRFRGVSQSDGELAIQGGVAVAHRSGLYVATWASNLAGDEAMLSYDALADMVRRQKAVQCVILNACHSMGNIDEAFAPLVVGMMDEPATRLRCLLPSGSTTRLRPTFA